MIDFEHKLKDYVHMIETDLSFRLPEIDTLYSRVNDAMRYSVLNGGKRLRGVLVLSICEMLGEDLSQALVLASAVECVHAASLIHDDLPCMDDDALRRGKPSCHIAFDEATALLAGDALFLYAFQMISIASCTAGKKAEAMRILSEASGVHGMVGGQMIDLAYEKRPITYAVLQQMHLLKTAALIKAACLLGAVSAGADEAVKKKLSVFAQHLGMAFQICDDILDVIGNEESLGKPVGSDEKAKKSNFITLFGLEKAQEMANEATQKALSSIQGFKNNDFLEALTLKLLNRRQ